MTENLIPDPTQQQDGPDITRDRRRRTPPPWFQWLFAIMFESFAILATIKSVTVPATVCYVRALCIPDFIAAENTSERFAGIAIVAAAAALVLAYTAGRTARSAAAR